MTKNDYAKERRPPMWQKKRADILARDNCTCTQCGQSEEMIHIHHLYYVHGRKCWEYPDWSLISLCESCHKERHQNGPNSEEYGDPMTSLEEAISFVGDGPKRCIQWDASMFDLMQTIGWTMLKTGMEADEIIGDLLARLKEIESENVQQAVHQNP